MLSLRECWAAIKLAIRGKRLTACAVISKGGTEGWVEGMRKEVLEDEREMGASLLVQCLRICLANARDASSIPGLGGPHMLQIIKPGRLNC